MLLIFTSVPALKRKDAAVSMPGWMSVIEMKIKELCLLFFYICIPLSVKYIFFSGSSLHGPTHFVQHVIQVSQWLSNFLISCIF